MTDLSVVTEFAKQIDKCDTVFDIARSVIRNFVGYFLPKNAVFLISPSSSHPYYLMVEKYGATFSLPSEIPGNGGLMPLTKGTEGPILISDIKLDSLLEAEKEMLSHFDYFLSIESETQIAIMLFSFNSDDNKMMGEFEIEFSKIISLLTGKAIKNLQPKKDIHLDKVTRVLVKDVFWSMMEHHKNLVQELVTDDHVSFNEKENIIERRVFVGGLNDESSLEIGYTIILINLDGLETINKQFDYQMGNKILNDFGLSLKLLFRKSDITARYSGCQFAILLPLTQPDFAKIIIPKIRDLAKRIKEDSFLPDAIPFDIKIGMAHYPTDGDGVLMLLNTAEKNMS